MRSRVTDRAKNHLILLAMLVLLGLTGVVAVVRSPVLGLDLRGGLEVVLKAVPNDPKNPPTQDQINQAISIIRSRVDKLGVSEPEIRKEANNQVSIALAGHQGSEGRGQHHRLDRPALHARLHRHARAHRLEERQRAGLLPAEPVRAAECGQEPPQHALLRGLDARAVVRLRREDAQARCSTRIGQPFPPGASKKQLLTDLRGQAKNAVILRSPAGTVWANDPVAGLERRRGSRSAS